MNNTPAVLLPDVALSQLRIDKPQLLIPHLRKVREYIEAMEDAALRPPEEKPTEAGIAIGDLVQLKPTADKTWGGIFLRVCKLDPIRGYFLTPHRGGCMEAWHRTKPCEVSRIGAVRWPECKWGFTHWYE